MKRTLEEQLKRRLNEKKAFGVSRRSEKIKERERMEKAGEKVDAVNVRVKTIHSRGTYRKYEKIGRDFCKYCVERGASRRMSLGKAIEKYGADYLKQGEESGKSVYTLKTERAALGKILGKPLEYPLRARTRADITRSREETKRDRHFSEEKNAGLVLVAKATGCRRADLARLKWSDVIEINGRLCVKILGSKGGRDRIAPILPSLEKYIRQIVEENADKAGRIFESIPSCMDVHAYRREYAQTLYKEIGENSSFKRDMLKFYPIRHETAKGEYYIARGDCPFKGRRDDIYIVSQALGHNRLNVTVNHYLR